MAAPIPAEPKLPKRAFAIIFGVSMATALGNTGLMSVLPVIGRTLAIPDYLISGIFSISAILWAFSSPFWARTSDRHGRKPLMMLGLSGFMVSMIVCGAIVTAGMRQMAAPMVIFGMLLLGRALFGFFGASSNPATQAYVAEHSSREERTRSMANLAGAFGLGTVIGPFVAPLFILPKDNIAGPLFGFAAILWGLHTGLTQLPNPLLPMVHWIVWWNALYMLFVGLLCLFCLRFAEVDWPWFRRLVVGFVAVVPAVAITINDAAIAV